MTRLDDDSDSASSSPTSSPSAVSLEEAADGVGLESDGTRRLVLSATSRGGESEIIAGRGATGRLGALTRTRTRSRRPILICDSGVPESVVVEATRSLEASDAPPRVSIAVDGGESAKSWSRLESLCETILSSGFERGDAIVVVGGGAVLDSAGFAASILHRGSPTFLIPTTLLSQVDAAVGGKTAINASRSKNAIGSFHAPSATLIDPDALASLSVRAMRSGCAELVKHALIADAELFESLGDSCGGMLDGEGGLPSAEAIDSSRRRDAIFASCRVKASVVSADPFEESSGRGGRALLNFGHTFGHALESLCGFDDGILTHGEAVSIGMGMAFRFSESIGRCSVEEGVSARSRLSRLGLPTSVFDAPSEASSRLRSLGWESCLSAMRRDKKNRSASLTLVLSEGVGRAYVERDADVEVVASFLRREFSSSPADPPA